MMVLRFKGMINVYVSVNNGIGKKQQFEVNRVKQQLEVLFNPHTDSGQKYQKQFQQIYKLLDEKNITKLCYGNQLIELEKRTFILTDYSNLIKIYYNLRTYIFLYNFLAHIFWLTPRITPMLCKINFDKLVNELEKYQQQEPISKLKFNQKQINTKYKKNLDWDIDFQDLLEDGQNKDDIAAYLQEPINYMWEICELLFENKDFLIDQVTYLHGVQFIPREDSFCLQITNMIALCLTIDDNSKAKFYKAVNLSIVGNAFDENWEEIHKEVKIWIKTGIYPNEEQLQQLQQSVSKPQNKHIKEDSQQKNEVLTSTDSDPKDIAQPQLIIQEYKMENQQKQKLILNTQEQQEQQTILEQHKRPQNQPNNTSLINKFCIIFCVMCIVARMYLFLTYKNKII